MICHTSSLGSGHLFRFAVIFSRYQGKWLLSRHRDRNTWEPQGGHIEPGETPLAAARRELYEESGAARYTIKPVCDYWAGAGEEGAWGQVFLAHIEVLGEMPPSEIACTASFDVLPPPQQLTYPDITPVLFRTLEDTLTPMD